MTNWEKLERVYLQQNLPPNIQDLLGEWYIDSGCLRVPVGCRDHASAVRNATYIDVAKEISKARDRYSVRTIEYFWADGQVKLPLCPKHSLLSTSRSHLR